MSKDNGNKMSYNDLIDKIDDTCYKTRHIIDNFDEFEKEIGKKPLLRLLSKTLMENDFSILELMRELKIPDTKFNKRRDDGNGGPPPP
jgi:hypothetical protein